MQSIHEFLTMGGYAAYVWPAYGIAAVIIVVNCIAPLRRLRRVKADIRRQKRATA